VISADKFNAFAGSCSDCSCDIGLHTGAPFTVVTEPPDPEDGGGWTLAPICLDCLGTFYFERVHEYFRVRQQWVPDPRQPA
jgi:hypothetical protein